MAYQLTQLTILLMNLSYSMQRDQVFAESFKQQPIEWRAKGAREICARGGGWHQIHIHAKFPSISSRHFLPICTP